MKNIFLFSKKRFWRQLGFSVTELLVVMFIIGLISAIILANYRSGQRKYALTQAVQKLVSDIRKAQNMALSGLELAGAYYGYGVYLDEGDSYYIIYGDVNGNTTYQPADVIIETISLPDNIGIQSVSPASGKLSVFFEPPQPITYLNGDDAADVSEIIVLELENYSLTKTVRVTTAGLVQVE